MLRKHLGEKVKGVFYGEKKDVRDPITGIIEKKSLKPLLVNQVVLLLERGQLRIPNRDINETIHRQMINFRVTKVSSATQEPTFSDTDEHGLDAMIFALTGFMDEYPNLIDIIEEVKMERDMYVIQPNRYDAMQEVENQLINGLNLSSKPNDPGEREVKYNKVPLGYSKKKNNYSFNSMGWGGNADASSIWKKKF